MMVLILWQMIDRKMQSDKMDQERQAWTAERSHLIKAVMAKNINEYNSAVIADRVSVDIPNEPDDIPLSEASDETFDKHIKSQTQ